MEGILLAFGAMLCWGMGDFFIQRTTRKLGDWEALFFISIIGFFVVLPFVVNDMRSIVSEISVRDLPVLAIACVAILIAAIFNFETLKKGKLAIVEPIQSLEIPTAGILAFFFLQETISFPQFTFVALLMVGLILVSFKGGTFSKKLLLEKGVRIGIISAIIMGAANFFIGWGARISNPLIINLITDAFMVIGSGIYLIFSGKVSSLAQDFRNNFSLLIAMGLADKMAWVAFAFAMVLSPMAVAGAISESYILIAIVLGVVINKEKIRPHQAIGLVCAVAAAIILAATIA
ncbi:MAG: DMT family transporter [Candidatus Paceibacterota bacterium]|jgi:uncharacterized membrane protein